MKKLFGMVCAGLVVMGVLILVQDGHVYAAMPAKAGAVAATATPAPTPKPTPVEYLLPFPGILPTHPLYVFKSLRDKIIEMLITDPVSKAEFYILQADKKLNMGITLAALGKTADARLAFADALASRTQAAALLEEHIKSGNSVPGHLMEKLTLSLIKHREVLAGAGEGTDAVEALRVRVQKLTGSVVN